MEIFKEITIGFNYGLQTTSEFPASFSDSLFDLIGKCCYYPCPHFIFSVAQSFVGLSLHCTSHTPSMGLQSGEFYFPTPLHEQDATQGPFLSNVQQVWIQFSFS